MRKCQNCDREVTFCWLCAEAMRKCQNCDRGVTLCWSCTDTYWVIDTLDW